MHKIILLLTFTVLISYSLSKKFNENEKPEWAKKDIRDFSDADMERLLDQWEEDEEPLEPDELPEHLRPPPQVDFSKMTNPEDMLKASKKGRTLMSFVSVNGNPTREETDQITRLWQNSLRNAHIQAERYLIDDNRAIFMFADGAQSWEAKEYLINQERCLDVTIEQKKYDGLHNKQKTTKSVDEL
ncbi:LDLR chaperone boca [Chrysoperla carnea]|uniref:LDLR chaperone boca n=1 Tax=Chrysoperla carnea TaxID=189513 RepID=UPI001D067DBC|nr:LDLR chaperone boca [Chrysoperla carnea]